MTKEQILNKINEKKKYINYLKDTIGDRPNWMPKNNSQYLLQIATNDLEKLEKELINAK